MSQLVPTLHCRPLDCALLLHRGLQGVVFPDFLSAVKSHCMTIDSWLAICVYMTEGLRSLHSQGIAHGDIKLSNMCLNMDDDRRLLGVYLVDFGACSPGLQQTCALFTEPDIALAVADEFKLSVGPLSPSLEQ